jgi:hypothetical protein
MSERIYIGEHGIGIKNPKNKNTAQVYTIDEMFHFLDFLPKKFVSYQEPCVLNSCIHSMRLRKLLI